MNNFGLYLFCMALIHWKWTLSVAVVSLVVGGFLIGYGVTAGVSR